MNLNLFMESKFQIVKRIIWSKKLLLADALIFLIILINSVVIYLQVSGAKSQTLDLIDLICTLIFLVEMCMKIHMLGWKGYWKNGWNRMDGTLVILSIPSIFAYFVPVGGINMSVMLALRLLRALRFFRSLRLFKSANIDRLGDAFIRAMKASKSVLATFFLLVIILGLINCSLFGQQSPEYFGTPLQSIYSVFRLFTIEGWYEIPDSLSSSSQYPYAVSMGVKLYFCVLLIIGGVIGMSFLNSVFVDSMTENNNDDVKQQLEDIKQQLKVMSEKLDRNNNQNT